MIKFVVATTVPREADARDNIHGRIAVYLLDFLAYPSDVQFTRILAKEILELKIGGNEDFRAHLKTVTNNLLDSKIVIDSQAIKSLKKFISMMDGNLKATDTGVKRLCTSGTDDCPPTHRRCVHTTLDPENVECNLAT